jgi:hypothetical protein
MRGVAFSVAAVDALEKELLDALDAYFVVGLR